MGKKAKLWKKIILCSLTILIAGIISIAALVFSIYYFDFMCTDRLEMIAFDQKKCSLNIPVQYLDRGFVKKTGVPIYTKTGWTYSLKNGNSADDMLITILRWGLGGFVVYTARYEITDNSVKQKLLQLWIEHHKEPPIKLE